MDRKQMAEAVVEALQELEVNGPNMPNIGICSNIRDTLVRQFRVAGTILAFWNEELGTAFLDWKDPMASGCEVYPILGPYAQPVNLMWDRGPVAAARWRLVYHLITHFTSIAEEAE